MKKSGTSRGSRRTSGKRRRRRYTRRYEITVPTHDNQGNPFHPERLNTVVLKLNAISGGYTRLPVRIYRALLEARFAQAEIYVRSYRVTGVRRFGQLA